MLQAYVTGEADAWDVVSWAYTVKAELSPNRDAAVEELVGVMDDAFVSAPPFASEDKITALLMRMIPGANEVTPIRMKLAFEAERLLKKQLRPLEFCKMVAEFEAYLLDRASVECPQWIGDLWNACDWCDETWMIESASGLKDTVQEFLSANDT